MNLPENVEEILPLSPVQTGMLFHSVTDAAGPGAYVGIVSLVIDGPLEAVQFRSAFNTAVQARDVLRAGFLYRDIKTPVQIVHRQITVPWTEDDWSNLLPCEIEARRQDLIARERREGFDLGAAPLMRVNLIRLGAAQHLLVWSLHHILSDGWSTSVILQDILRLYDAGPDTKRKEHCTFRDYLAWLKRKDTAAAEAYWTRHLAGFEGPTRLANQTPKGQTQDLHAITTRQVGPADMGALDTRARQLRVTQSSLLSAIWAVVLRRYSGSEDITYGVSTAGRPVDLPDVANAVGPFVNTLPVRFAISGTMEFDHLALQVEATMREREPHDFAALTDVREWAGVQAGQQLFETLFVHESIPELDGAGQSLRISQTEILGPSNYGLALVATPVDGLRLDIYFDPAQYGAGLIDAILADYVDVLRQILASPDTPVGELFAARWPAEETAQPGTSVLAAFLSAAEARPDDPAVSDSTQTLSYGALHARVEHIACGLRAAGIGPGAIVPVAMERSADTVAAYLGVMATGAAYVPMDLDYPLDKLRQILMAVAPKWVLTTRTLGGELPEGPWQLIMADALAPDTPPEPIALPEHGTTAYVLFTSGSQGIPKGVVVSHGALAHSTLVRDTVYGGPPERFLLLSSFAFDSSVVGLYWTLTTGGHLVIAPRKAERDPAGLCDLVRSKHVTHLLCLPGLYQALLETSRLKTAADLSTIIVAGEAVQPGLIARHREALPNCRLFNEYGPTEATVWATAYDTEGWSGGPHVPIGQAIQGVTARVCDLDTAPLPDGMIGELYLSGPTLADGYLNDPERSAAHFPVRKNDGLRRYRTGDLCMQVGGDLVFVGRRDQQVKIRGHRIELGEVESVVQVALAQHTSCAVKSATGDSAQVALCIEGQADAALEAGLTQALATRLPEHARPRRILWVTKMPRLPNGKLDRGAVAALFDGDAPRNAGGEMPQPGTEARLAEIWGALLGVADIARDSNFFDLGGDSLKTISLYAMAEREGFVLSPNDIFEHPTLSALAAKITASAQDDYAHLDGSDVRKVHLGGDEVPVILVHANMLIFNQLARGLGKRRPLGLQFSSLYDGKSLRFGTGVSEMAAQAIDAFGDLLDRGRCILVGYSAGAAIALRMAEMLRQRGCVTALLCLADPPHSFRDPSGTSPAPMARVLGEHAYYAAGYARHTLAGDLEARRKFQVNRATALAMHRFTIRPYTDPTLIFTTVPMTAPPPLFPNAQVEHLPYGHMDLTNDRNAAHAFAARLITQIRALSEPA